MTKFLGGVVSALLLVAAGFFIWKGQAEQDRPIPASPAAPSLAVQAAALPSAGQAELPKAAPKTREQKRFNRADKDDDGKITLAELYEPRRKAFAKIDRNGDGRLSFEEWAIKTGEKFSGADGNRDGALTPAEFATTAPKPAKRKAACSC